MAVMDFFVSLKENADFASIFFNRIIIAFIIFVIGLMIGRVMGNFVKKILHEIELNKMLKSANVKMDLEDRLGKLVKYLIYFFAAVIALNQLGWASTLLSWISIGILIVIIVGFLLAVKDYIPNMIAGFVIMKNKTFKVGDTIEAAGAKGKVVKIRLVETEIKSKGDVLFIPNATIMKSKLKVRS